MRIAYLRRDLRAPNEGRVMRLEPFAEDAFTRTATVSVRGVEPPESDAARMVEKLQRLLFAVSAAAQVRRRTDAAEIAAAEDNPVEITLGEHAFLPSAAATPLLDGSAANGRARA